MNSVRLPLIGAPRPSQTVNGIPCFYEANPSAPLLRRGMVEGVGTLFLMFTVTACATLPSTQFGSALAVPAVLVSLIVAFGAVSGGHFNPLITFLQWLARERTAICTLTYIGSQTLGAMLGACLAGAMFGLKRSAMLTAEQGLWNSSEVVATAGLLVVVFGCARSEHAQTGPFAVGAWLLAIAVTMPSAYANPALTLGALVAAGPVALSGPDVLRHVPSQFLGALMAFALIRAAYASRSQ